MNLPQNYIHIDGETAQREYDIEQEFLKPIIEFMQANNVETFGEAVHMMGLVPTEAQQNEPTEAGG